MQQYNLDLLSLDLIELAKAASELRNRSSIYALHRLCAIRREQIRRITEQQEGYLGTKTGSHSAGH